MKNNKLWLWVLAIAMTISLLFAVFAITTHASSGSDPTVLYTPDAALTKYAILPRVTISGSSMSYQYYVIWYAGSVSTSRTDYSSNSVTYCYAPSTSYAYCLFDTFEAAVSGIKSPETVYSTSGTMYFIQGTSMTGSSYTIDWTNYYSSVQLSSFEKTIKKSTVWNGRSTYVTLLANNISSDEVIKVIGEEEEEYCEITVTYPYGDDLMGTPADSVSVLVGSFWNLTSTGICNEAGEYIYQWDFPCTHWTTMPVSEVYSTVTPNGVLPSDFTASSDVHLYFYNYVPVQLSVPVISMSNGVISWPEIPNATGYQLKINGEVQSGQIAGNSWNAYNNIDDIGSYSISVRALALVGGEFYYSAWSNALSYEAMAPVINRFEIVDKTLYYDFGGTLATGTLYRSGASISDDISVGAYNFDLSNISDGLYSFRLTVTNKYGTISSGTIDYFVGFANDTYGTFYSVGVIMEQIVDLLKDVQFFGISLWMLLCTSFVITLIIPFLCIIVLPSRGIHGYSPRGGNDTKSKNDGSAHDKFVDKDGNENVRARMQQYERGDK